MRLTRVLQICNCSVLPSSSLTLYVASSPWRHKLVQWLLGAAESVVDDFFSSRPKILKRFRQAVLAAAFSGRLTAAWRDQHKNIELGQVLFGRVSYYRRRAWETTRS
jgi:hypothetical protein